MAELIKQSWLFPVIQSIHIIGLTLVMGTVCIVDLRLLGITMRRQTVRTLASTFMPWTIGGLVTVLITGPLLFGSDIERYLKNPAFLLKMVLLVIALAAHARLHFSVVRNDTSFPTMSRKFGAALSLILWCSVVLAGRAIADFDINPH